MSNVRTLDGSAERKRAWDPLRRWFARPASPAATSVIGRNAAAAVGGPPVRTPWPPNLPDPRPDWSSGLPEVNRERLSGDVIGGSILHHGSLLVRGLIDERGVRRLVGVLERAFEDAAAALQGHDPRPDSYFSRYPLGTDSEMTEEGRVFVMRDGGVWTADSPPAMTVLIEELRRAGIVQAIEDYLGEPAYLSVGKSTLRKVPPTSGAGWHQDGAFLGADIRTVNCWLALSDCGEDSPGLDIYPGRLDYIVETGTQDAPYAWAVGDAVVEALPRRWAAPRFKAGDALFFDQLMLHRTGVRPGMVRDRLAIESWMFAGSTFPARQIPLAL